MDTVNKAITVYLDKNGKEITEEEYWKIQKGTVKGETIKPPEESEPKEDKKK